MRRVLWPALIVAAGLFLVNLGLGLDMMMLSTTEPLYGEAVATVDFAFHERPLEQASAVLPGQ